MTKSWMALGGCYLLFVFEKVMDFFGEVKKKRVSVFSAPQFNAN
jgi:hypothetical protein